MRKYIYGLILVAVTGALAELLSLGDEGQGSRLSVKFVTGLCLLLACVKPLSDGMVYMKEMLSHDMPLPWEEASSADEAYQAVWESLVCDVSGYEIERWVYDTLGENFGVGEDVCDVHISIEMTDDVPMLSEVYITLWGQAIWQNPHQIEQYIEANLSCPCHVSVGSLGNEGG